MPDLDMLDPDMGIGIGSPWNQKDERGVSGNGGRPQVQSSYSSRNHGATVRRAVSFVAIVIIVMASLSTPRPADACMDGGECSCCSMTLTRSSATGHSPQDRCNGCGLPGSATGGCPAAGPKRLPMATQTEPAPSRASGDYSAPPSANGRAIATEARSLLASGPPSLARVNAAIKADLHILVSCWLL
jgi:hypothetical protein